MLYAYLISLYLWLASDLRAWFHSAGDDEVDDDTADAELSRTAHRIGITITRHCLI